MLKGIYSAASGMTGQMMMLDGMADSMANINTPGYKQASSQFKPFAENLISRLNNGESAAIGNFAQGAQVMCSTTNFKQGELTQTGNTLDMALQGNGFFAVKQDNGQLAYTRSGNFQRGADGFLTTLNGQRVQGLVNGKVQDINIPVNAVKIDVAGNGDINVDGKVVGRMDVVQFKDPQSLERLGNSLYTSSQPGQPATDTTVQQGFLEGSNANMISEMVNSISGIRTYEALQKSISMQNETLGQAINTVGRLG